MSFTNYFNNTPFERLNALMEKRVLEPELVTDLKEVINQILSFYVRLRWQQTKTGVSASARLSLHSLTPREKEELVINLRILKEMQNKLFYYFNMKV